MADNLIPATFFTTAVQDSHSYPVPSINANVAVIYSTLSQKSDITSTSRPLPFLWPPSGDITITTEMEHTMIDTIINTVTSLTADTKTALANGFTPVVFTAIVKNSNGQSVAHSDVSFTNTGGTLSQQTTTTNTNGEATVSLTCANIGDTTVTAKVNNNAADAGKSATVAFIADAATAGINTLAANPDIAPADNLTPITFTATVKDSYGHFVSGLSVSFTTTGGTLSQKTVITNANGQASVRLTSEKMGEVTVTAKAGTNDIGKSKAVTFIDNLTTAIVASVGVHPRTIVADPPWKTTVTATVKKQ
ncbi:Ig-like domain-containing protein [Pectobacterium parvum]|uniref:Big-1 domain-containing protein n=1 Tax=Pectobacterium parvum TaxID=2778550 RepID=A0AAP9IGZ0_9GAMM|nr:Ig-like domain-containing protein [Pectobacterium parvum]QHQ24512.1 hypothetical protein GMX10_10885 [Pectobacterium parvum]